MKILLHKDRTREIWKLAGPVVAGMVSQTLLNVVDTAMVGRLGATALAAAGLGGVLAWMILGSLGALNIGVQAVTSRRWGEKNYRDAGKTLDNAILLALAFGLVCNLLMAPVMRIVFAWFSTDANVIEEGRNYIFFRLQGGIPLMLIMAHRGFFNGIGKTHLHMKVAILVNASNVFFNYLLIFGHFGFPRMETAGAGLASALGTFCGMLYFLYLGLKENRSASYKTYQLRNISRDGTWRILRLAIPSGLHSFLIMLGFSIFSAIVARLGTVEMAATNVVITVISLSFLPGFGLGVASATIIGQKLGEGNPDLAEAYGWEAAKSGILFMGALGIVFFTFPTLILELFTEDLRVIEAGVLPLRMMGFVQIFDAVGMVISQALEGAGFNKWVLKAEVAVNWGVFLPLTWIFTFLFGWGLTGAWIALAIYLVLFAVVVSRKFTLGEWKSAQV